jgi:hypothetical protein
MKKKVLHQTGVLVFAIVLTGCAAGGPATVSSVEQEEALQQAASSQSIEGENPAEASEPVEEEKNPCDVISQQLVEESRNTMKTVDGTCQDQKIEVNPMWAIDYDGSVRIRIYDAAGNLISESIEKP